MFTWCGTCNMRPMYLAVNKLSAMTGGKRIVIFYRVPDWVVAEHVKEDPIVVAKISSNSDTPPEGRWTLLAVGGKEEREVDVRIVSQSNADVGSNFGFDEECAVVMVQIRTMVQINPEIYWKFNGARVMLRFTQPFLASHPVNMANVLGDMNKHQDNVASCTYVRSHQMWYSKTRGSGIPIKVRTVIPPENKQTKLFSFKWDIPPDTWRKARIVPGAHCGIPVGTEVRVRNYDNLDDVGRVTVRVQEKGDTNESRLVEVPYACVAPFAKQKQPVRSDAKLFEADDVVVAQVEKLNT